MIQIATIRAVLDGYIWRCPSEADLHRQMIHVFAKADMDAEHEVKISAGRLDFLVTVDGVRVALEVKIKGSATEIERQAQRYALSGEVDAVVVVTTRRKLALQLNARELGGRPFAAIALRGAF